jgi:hypothetical protein
MSSQCVGKLKDGNEIGEVDMQGVEFSRSSRPGWVGKRLGRPANAIPTAENREYLLHLLHIFKIEMYPCDEFTARRVDIAASPPQGSNLQSQDTPDRKTGISSRRVQPISLEDHVNNQNPIGSWGSG